MKKILFVTMVLAFTPVTMLAQSAAGSSAAATTTPPAAITTVAEPGLLPGNFFYFLDRWGEALNTFFTFNQEKKARMHLEYAKERVAEIKAVLKDPVAKVSSVAEVKQNFDQQMSDAAAIIKQEKAKNVNVSSLEREYEDDLNSTESELTTVFDIHKDQVSRAENEIRSKLEALGATSTPQAQGLEKALEAIIKEKRDLGQEDGEGDIEEEGILGQAASSSQPTKFDNSDERSRLTPAHSSTSSGQRNNERNTENNIDD